MCLNSLCSENYEQTDNSRGELYPDCDWCIHFWLQSRGILIARTYSSPGKFRNFLYRTSRHEGWISGGGHNILDKYRHPFEFNILSYGITSSGLGHFIGAGSRGVGGSKHIGLDIENKSRRHLLALRCLLENVLTTLHDHHFIGQIMGWGQ